MSEDWNLQDEMKHILCEGHGDIGTFAKLEYTKAGGADVTDPRSLELYYYCPSVMEKLRKKLIEELCSELISGTKESSCDSIPQPLIRETINLVFGVKK